MRANKGWMILAGGMAALALAACTKPAPAKAPEAPPAATPVAATYDPAADTAAAKAFLEGVYAHYKTSGGPSFDAMGANVHEVFDAEMAGLFEQDSKLLNGELGDIDGDWLCQCQDFDSIVPVIAVQSVTATTAKATADFKVFDDKRHNAFDLVKENGAWRIHDIVSPPDKGLRQVLIDEIALLSKPSAKKAAKDDG